MDGKRRLRDHPSAISADTIDSLSDVEAPECDVEIIEPVTVLDGFHISHCTCFSKD